MELRHIGPVTLGQADRSTSTENPTTGRESTWLRSDRSSWLSSTITCPASKRADRSVRWRRWSSSFPILSTSTSLLPTATLATAAAIEGIAINCWTKVGNAHVFYRAPGASGWRALAQDPRVRDYDLMYLSGIFSRNSSMRPLSYLRTGQIRQSSGADRAEGRTQPRCTGDPPPEENSLSQASPRGSAFTAMSGGAVPASMKPTKYVSTSGFRPTVR